ncbi:MAG: RNB domain-containing ribonuclease [Deltaproteobacteria bacterium]|nr:RNB domain-containing ribonuclease [Deltaproteobacteria bacterium]
MVGPRRPGFDPTTPIVTTGGGQVSNTGGVVETSATGGVTTTNEASQPIAIDAVESGGSRTTPIVVASATITNTGTATVSELSAAHETLQTLGDPQATEALNRVQRRAAVEVPIRARVATARANGRMPGEVPGILRERQGRITFYPADESLLPFELDRAKADGLPRDVLLIARVTKKELEVVDERGNNVKATLYTLRQERQAKLGGCFTGIVDLVDGTPHLKDLATGQLHLLEGTFKAGTVVAGHVDAGGRVVLDQTIAVGESAQARSWTVAAGQRLDPTFPSQAVDEAAAILKNPGLDDRSLVDRRSEPFFAIDNHGSKDIDQAMRLTRRSDGGFVLQYALADMAHAVKPGMALWDEALQRGASFYLPGVNVPMQPRDVCEKGVSLNAHEDHRAVVITVELDSNGKIEKTSSERAVIRSQAQLTYPGVSAFLGGKAGIDKDDHGHDVPKAVKDQLGVFQALGSVLQRQAHQRGMVSPERREMRIGLDGGKFLLHEVESDLASGLNAELSILANCMGASQLAHTGIPGIEAPGIFRVHPPPGPEKLEALRRLVGAIVDANHAPASWRWQQGEALNDWVERVRALPTTEREHALAIALQNQVIGIQVSSEYAREPALHSGLMVEGYGRFTAPMREVVGLLSHATLVQLESLKRMRALGVADADLKPLWQHLLLGALVRPSELSAERAALAKRAVELETLRGPALLTAARALLADLARAPALTDAEKKAVDATVDRAVSSGNSSRMKQKQCDNASTRLLFDDLFRSDLAGIAAGNPNAPVREGTVLNASPGRLTVLLKNPEVEVKIGREDLGDAMLLDRDGAEVRYTHKNGQQCSVLVGAAIRIRASHHDGEKLHFAIVD